MEILKADIDHYEHQYNKVWWPKFYMMRQKDYEPDKNGFPWFWKYSVLNWLYRVFDSIREYCFTFGAFSNWDRHCSPSFPDGFLDLWDNMMVFLTPWYRVRRNFILGFINLNETKLLNHNRYFAYIRTRGDDCAYYDLVFTGFRYKLVKSQLFKKGETEARNHFMEAISLIGKSDDEIDKFKNSFEERFTTVCTGWVFGWKSAVRELNKIAYLTQSLKWFSPTETKKEGASND